jgi:hypothetical protein
MSYGDYMQTEETMSLRETFCLQMKPCQPLKLTTKPRKPCLSSETFNYIWWKLCLSWDSHSPTYHGNLVSHWNSLSSVEARSLIETLATVDNRSLMILCNRSMTAEALSLIENLPTLDTLSLTKLCKPQRPCLSLKLSASPRKHKLHVSH